MKSAIGRCNHFLLKIQCFITILLGCHVFRCYGRNDQALEDMFGKMTGDALNFAKYMENVYGNRCTLDVIVQCKESSYASCSSEFPTSSCLGEPEWAIPDCAKNSCGAFFDFTTTSVRISDGSESFTEQRNPSIKDSVCYTQQADSYMLQQYDDNQGYWNQFGVQPPWYHYGADSGVFRIFPARSQDVCGSYDPRIRPWYVGASSGPKDIVLVIDTSSSSGESSRLETMKSAASRVIGTLGLQDYVAIVAFDSTARRLGSSGFTLDRATSDNKQWLIGLVSELEASGESNYISGFQLAFDILETSASSTDCHKAILFLTDGGMTMGSDAELYQLVTNRRLTLAQDNDSSTPVIFAYSFGEFADETIPKSIACQTDGIWSRVLDGQDLGESMAGYYKYFAYGLGDSDFVSWSEPYNFATGGHLGTTASAPVYDRSVEPNILIGVVGLDFTFAAMEQALGVEGASGKEEVLKRLSERSVAQCPTINLTECDVQSLRAIGGSGIEALCPNQCNGTNLSTIVSKICDTASHPDNIWSNLNTNGHTYKEKTCCTVGEIRKPGQVPYEKIQQSQCSGNDVSAATVLFFGTLHYFVITAWVSIVLLYRG